jgi:LPXTG-motif cell wall-anchored protein
VSQGWCGSQPSERLPSEWQENFGGATRNEVQSVRFSGKRDEVNRKGRLKMRKLCIVAVLLLFTGLVVAQSTDNQSQGAASNAADQAQQAGSNAAGQANAGQSAGQEQNAGQSQPGAAAGGQTGAPPAGQAGAAGETAGATAGTAAAGHKHLPQTGSPLPLLGLLGLGSVSIGLWKARYLRR